MERNILETNSMALSILILTQLLLGAQAKAGATDGESLIQCFDQTKAAPTSYAWNAMDTYSTSVLVQKNLGDDPDSPKLGMLAFVNTGSETQKQLTYIDASGIYEIDAPPKPRSNEPTVFCIRNGMTDLSKEDFYGTMKLSTDLPYGGYGYGGYGNNPYGGNGTTSSAPIAPTATTTAHTNGFLSDPLSRVIKPWAFNKMNGEPNVCNKDTAYILYKKGPQNKKQKKSDTLLESVLSDELVRINNSYTAHAFDGVQPELGTYEQVLPQESATKTKYETILQACLKMKWKNKKLSDMIQGELDRIDSGNVYGFALTQKCEAAQALPPVTATSIQTTVKDLKKAGK